MNEYYDRSMPIGLAMMLAQNNDAMRNFALMDESDQRAVLERARRAQSKAQMQALVGGIAAGIAAGGIAGGPIVPGIFGGGTDRFDDPRVR